jgi:hypothetical protein
MECEAARTTRESFLQILQCNGRLLPFAAHRLLVVGRYASCLAGTGGDLGGSFVTTLGIGVQKAIWL